MTRHPPRPPLFPYTPLFRSIPPLAPAKFTGSLWLTSRHTLPECTAFDSSVQKATGTYVQTVTPNGAGTTPGMLGRSEEHTSELQSRLHLVCRLLLEKKNKNQ